MINSQDSHVITELIQSLPLPEIEKRTPLQISMLVLLEAMNRRMDFIEAYAKGGQLADLVERLENLMERIDRQQRAKEKVVAK